MPSSRKLVWLQGMGVKKILELSRKYHGTIPEVSRNRFGIGSRDLSSEKWQNEWFLENSVPQNLWIEVVHKKIDRVTEWQICGMATLLS